MFASLISKLLASTISDSITLRALNAPMVVMFNATVMANAIRTLLSSDTLEAYQRASEYRHSVAEMVKTYSSPE